MKNQILQQLKTINSLSVNTALWVFRRSFDNYYQSVSKLKLEVIDNWVKSLNSPDIEKDWLQQKQRKYPLLFIYGMLEHYKYKTLQEKNYQRENLKSIFIPNSKIDFYKHTSVVKQVTKHVLSLPFDEGISFLGELIGTWMITCPEVIVRSENNVKKIGEWRVGKETADWEVPIDWIKLINSNDESGKVNDKEFQLLYVLDFLLHFSFDDYDEANTS
jgi:hypothetical protein